MKINIQNYITRRKQNEDFESETESDYLSASANSGWNKQYDMLSVSRIYRYFFKVLCILGKIMFSIYQSLNIYNH